MDYQKIDTLFMRDENSIIMPDKFTLPEFEYLKDNKWECTEKIDGTNIHVDIFYTAFGDIQIEFFGRTSRAVIPYPLLAKLQSIFTKELIRQVFGNVLNEASSTNPFCISLFGEGYGMKIQKGGNYIKNDVDFILFDVRVGNWWLLREQCEEIAAKLGIKIVPLIGYMTIPEAIDFVKQGFKSTIAENKDYDAEGLVLKTTNGLKLRNGKRIITKIKTCDFQKYKAKYGDSVVEQKPNPHYNK